MPGWLIVVAAVGLIGLLIRFYRWIDGLLLKAEERGWIYYKHKSGSTGGNAIAAAMLEIDRATRPSSEYVVQAEDEQHTEEEIDGE